MKTRTWAHHLLIGCLLLTPSVYAGEGSGSAGGRGGGTGIVCSDHPLTTLEEFEMGTDSSLSSLPTTRRGIRNLIQKKLIQRPDLYAEWLKVWEAFEPYESWPLVDYNKGAEEAADRINQLVRQIYPLSDQAKSKLKKDFNLDFDDEFQPPANCKKVQLSLFDNGKVYRTLLSEKLSQRSRRIVELHESFYLIATEKYAHVNTIEVREWIRALIGNKSLTEADFERFETTAMEQAISGLSTGYFVATSFTSSCPQGIVTLNPPGKDLEVTMITENDHLPVQQRLKVQNSVFKSAIRDQTIQFVHENQILQFWPAKDFMTSGNVHLSYTVEAGESCEYQLYLTSLNKIALAKGTKKIWRLVENLIQSGLSDPIQVQRNP